MTTIYTSSNARPCMSCNQRAGYCLATCPDRSVSPADGLTMTGVIRAVQASQIDAEARTGEPWAPTWAVVVAFLGIVLIGVAVARNPIALMIWSWLNA